MANDIAIMRKVVYPPRGVIYDRKGKVMLNNEVVYDLVVTPIEAKKNQDTLNINETNFKKLKFKDFYYNHKNWLNIIEYNEFKNIF
jgi:cell division protein FtsI/penicillin-binding protein 2